MNLFNKLIKLIAPPILLISVKKIFRHAKGPFLTITYQGVYSSFKEVKDKYSLVNVYHTPVSSLNAYNSAVNSLSRYKNNDFPYDGWSLIRHNFLPTFISGIPEKEINILDVGGAYCDAYFSASYSCPEKEIRSTNVELSEIVKRGNDLFRDIPNLQLVTEMPMINGTEFNILNFGSSIQYFENFRDILKDLLKLNIEYIAISDTPMGYFKTFVCAQVNMEANVIPRLVFDIDELRLLFIESNYRLIHKSVNYYPFHNFDNYQSPYSSTRHMNLIFKLRQDR